MAEILHGTIWNPQMIKNQGKKNKKNLKRPITSHEIEAVIKKLPTNKWPGPTTSQGFYQALKEEAISIFRKLPSKNWSERNVTKLILKSQHYLITKNRQRYCIYKNLIIRRYPCWT